MLITCTNCHCMILRKIMQTSVYTSATLVHIIPMCVGSGIYKVILSPHQSLGEWKAGQFIMLSLESEQSCSFARPFSIASVDYSTITLYIQVRGKETKRIRMLQQTDRVFLWGPLGNSFSNSSKKTLIIAGGIGIAPFVTYTNQYTTPMTMLFGHRLSLENYPLDSLGKQTTVTAFHDTDQKSLQVFLDAIYSAMLEYKNEHIIACGPLPLLRYIRKIAIEHTIHTEISLEETMFCGIGACLGCVCHTTKEYPDTRLTDTYIQSCTYGPVFLANTVLI